MHPEQQTAPQASDSPLTPIAQIECWYLPEGSYTIFGYRKAVVVLYPGWMVIYGKSTNAELAKIQLTPDLKMKYFLGFVRFAQLNGRTYSAFKMNNLFMTTPMWTYGIFALALIANLVVTLNRYNVSNSLGSSLLTILLLGGALVLLASGMPKAKHLIEASKRAAGVAL